MKRIKDLLPTVLEALRVSGLVIPGEKRVLNEYASYVAAFAPSIATVGLRTTLSFYSDWEPGDPAAPGPAIAPRRFHVLNLICQIYRQKYAGGNGLALVGGDLLTIVLDQNLTPVQLRRLKDDLTDISVALKLVLRNFNLEKKTMKSEVVHENDETI